MLSTRVGFTGGHKDNPTYREVCKKDTGHAEAVEVTFDPEVCSYQQLVQFFFEMHDPTIDRTDKGGQYRSAIFVHNPEQEVTARELKNYLIDKGYKVTTEINPAADFWPASARHQKYCDSRGMQPRSYFTDRFGTTKNSTDS